MGCEDERVKDAALRLGGPFTAEAARASAKLVMEARERRCREESAAIDALDIGALWAQVVECEIKSEVAKGERGVLVTAGMMRRWLPDGVGPSARLLDRLIPYGKTLGFTCRPGNLCPLDLYVTW